MRHNTLLVILFAALTVTSCAKKETLRVRGPFVLKLGYIKGKHYLYESSMRNQSTMDMGGMSHTVNVVNDVKYELIPEDIKGDTMDITVTIKDVNISIQTPAGNKNLPEGNVLVGKSIKFTVLKNGNVIKRDTLAIGDEKLKTVLENMSKLFDFVPDVPVSLGSTWKDSTMEGVASFKLSDVKINGNDTLAIITFKATFNKNTSSQNNGMSVKTTIKGTGEGKIHFSINRGIILKSDMSAGLEGKAHMEGGMAGEGMDMPMYIDQTIESKLTKEY